ncbi:mono/diheme cytochrome c family protein [Paucibacter oligotrophus]|uniref:Mono/diheme cytochrome c family protein n=1 Tax=Roseateles oligotrophus TaxID=1769250 RepID=A0A840LDC3_9BURK|nr:cytochrome c family protein [Roseateles oligotrophus]MBB4843327.1 mono/diheme cytochrome c family protein [Roseateles oligotrophus]
MSLRLIPPVLLAAALWLGGPVQAAALVLPQPAELQARLRLQAQVVRVIEPHLSQAGRDVRRSYRAYPAPALLDELLGRAWRASPEAEIEFRALDGFVSRIPVAQLLRFPAFLAFARADGQAFQVDNHGQNERQVPLGPYYLIWDNIAAPQLRAEGGAQWPYQVVQIQLRPSSQAALLPAGMAARWAEQARAAQTYCLSCHQINGYGGDKMPLNLALRARQIEAGQWQRWLLEPAAVKPGTSMPPLPPGLPQAQREALATQLRDYLLALPLAEAKPAATEARP